ncbi:MAG: hypothetical protein AB1400_06175 [Pseudomonadota bacterium]
MCDSLTVVFPIKRKESEVQEGENFPARYLVQMDNNGELGNPFSRWQSVRSPLTGESFRIRTIHNVINGQHCMVQGYEVEINPPACLIGNNLLLSNSVYMAVTGTLKLLQYWLLTQGCTHNEIKLLSTRTARIKSATLTYLVECTGKNDAHVARRELGLHAAALKNKKIRAKPLLRNLVFSIGNDEEATVYMKHHDYSITAYVKDNPVGGASSWFASRDIEIALRNEARKYLRVEIKFGEKWLDNNDRNSGSSWKVADGFNPYDVGIATIREYLRLDENLRIRKPKREHLHCLSKDERKVLSWHLKGNNAKENELFRGCIDAKFYPMRIRILRKLRIDLGIPWRVQNSELRPRLNQLLAVEHRYKPPRELAERVYGPSSVKVAIGRLKELISKRKEALEGD